MKNIFQKLTALSYAAMTWGVLAGIVTDWKNWTKTLTAVAAVMVVAGIIIQITDE